MTNVIELAKRAGFPVHKSLLSGEEWPEIDGIDIEEELTRFAKLVRNAALEEAAQKCEYVGPQGSALSVINSAFAHEIRNLKEPTP